MAGGATLNLASSMNVLTAVHAEASANSQLVTKLGLDAAVVGQKVDATSATMDSLQKTINALSGTADSMGSGSVALGKKLDTLESTMESTLPGVGTISKRIDKTEET